ncbi:unnamed protein product [Rhizophagus irregularis]|uniref:Uncharacterized protein n=1 Tax=Rhizophagus irregularis TaxID=588596 RepID=A0A2N1M9X9_9GLOM|nr:hypothetical protein RhiirC2_796313 [Rhizophagus irregularis]CAB4388736.1 unnamed protein product [Rhizophagus irregularis]CAB4388776.1 unnamed protein product [Rhizophagus irregularis]
MYAVKRNIYFLIILIILRLTPTFQQVDCGDGTNCPAGTTCCGPICCNRGFKCCNEGINLGNELCCPISANCCARRSDGSEICCGGNTPACCITGGDFKNCNDPFAFTNEPHCDPF